MTGTFQFSVRCVFAVVFVVALYCLAGVNWETYGPLMTVCLTTAIIAWRLPWYGRVALIGCVCAGVSCACYWYIGGQVLFSPDTLDTRSRTEILVPFTNSHLYRGDHETSRFELVEYLVVNGYWTPRSIPKPEWIVESHWNSQWKGRRDPSTLRCDFSKDTEQWIEWTKSHPDLARELWPRVLAVLRNSRLRARENTADWLMAMAKNSQDVAFFKRWMAVDSDLKSYGYVP